ncbi:MAG: DNA polymerase III subunit gamma/tau [bacterium]
MGFLTLYRKYRPQQFKDLVGQDYVVKTLKNALKNQRTVHAYLFAGPRGTGKTSTAKVFAKALNCKDETSIEPCTECDNCKKIESGQSIDVIEIDAASNRGIDEIRELREKVKFYPGEGKYKVYIIDEVHMLTTVAFNALLKTLEEPPENVVFILATTEPHQVINTILSRCQRFDFSLLSVSDIVQRLIHICKTEEVTYEKDALNLIAHSSNGGLRDAISILDQAISYTDGDLRVELLSEMLGKINKEILNQFIELIVEKNTAEALQLLNDLIEKGKEVSRFTADFKEHCRQLLIIKQCGINSGLLQYSRDRLKLMKKESNLINDSQLLRIIDILTNIEKDLKFSNQPRMLVEMGIVKLTSPEADNSIEALQSRVSELEYKLREMNNLVGKASIISKENLNSNEKITEADGEKTGSEKRAENKESVENKNNKKVNTGKTDNSEPEITLDQVRKAWPAVLTQVKKEDIKSQAYLIEGKPVQVENNTIYIEFSQEKNFHKKCAQKRKKLIKKIFGRVLSLNCKVRFILEGELDKENFSGEEKSIESKPENKEKSGESSSPASEENLVEEVADLFNGEIIKADEKFLDN